MATLEKRITALESRASSTTIGPFFVHFVGLDTKDSEIERITRGDQEWQRQPIETEQELTERAKREAPPPKDGCSTVFMCW